MGRIVIAFVLLGLASVVSMRAAAAEDVDILLAELQITPLPATTPPPFKLETLDGKPFTLADLRGRPMLIYFWATW